MSQGFVSARANASVTLPRAFGHALALRRPPLCGELALWLLAEDVDLEAGCRQLHEGASPPYWAFCWGSGQGLARWLLDHPETVRDRRVVDLGAGSGVAGIAAARAGAAAVVAVDVDPDARAAIRANAAANGLTGDELRVAAAVPARWDLLLASDVLYEPDLAAVVAAYGDRARSSGAGVLVAEPERPGNPGYPLSALARYPARTLPDVDSPTVWANVYRLA